MSYLFPFFKKSTFKHIYNLHMNDVWHHNVFMDEDYVWWPPEITLFQSDVKLRTHVSPLFNLISCLQGQQKKIGGCYYIALVRAAPTVGGGWGVGGRWRHPTSLRVYKSGWSAGFLPKPPWQTSAAPPTPVVKGKSAALPTALLQSKLRLSSLLSCLLSLPQMNRGFGICCVSLIFCAALSETLGFVIAVSSLDLPPFR